MNKFAIYIETLGCKLNQIESESIGAAFVKEGFPLFIEGESEGLSLSQVKIVIVNTCTVTGKAEQKARHLIRQLLKKFPNSFLFVTGCYAQVEPKTITEISDRVLVVPGALRGKFAVLPEYINSVPNIFTDDSVLQNTLFSWEPVYKKQIKSESNLIETQDETVFDLSSDMFFFHSRASVKIQEGCNNKCSYCRIRLARGPSVSLDFNEVVNRIIDIENQGWAEVVLTGVNLSQYYSNGKDFAELIKEILNSTKKIQIRISSLYPQRVDKAFLDVISSPRIAPHFHLSIQSGSPKILKAMRRPYNIEQVFSAIEGLKKVKNNPFLACDLITGFPGETEEDFEKTLDLCTKAEFAWIHAFPFSARPGTEAWSMKPKIPERISHERVNQLIKIANDGRKKYISSWLGKIVPAIIEHGKEDLITCMTQNYLHGVLCNSLGVPIKKQDCLDGLEPKTLRNVKILEEWGQTSSEGQTSNEGQTSTILSPQIDVKVMLVP